MIPAVVGPFIYFFDNDSTHAYLQMAYTLSAWIGTVWAVILFILHLFSYTFNLATVGTYSLTAPLTDFLTFSIVNAVLYPLLWAFLLPTIEIYYGMEQIRMQIAKQIAVKEW